MTVDDSQPDAKPDGLTGNDRRERRREIGRRYRERHADELRERARQWRADNRDETNRRQREIHRQRRPDPVEGAAYRQAATRSRDKLRKQVFDRYGWSCACCGATENLSIDHVNGGGAEHRRELFGKQQGGHAFYRWLIREGFPDGYQTLCRPCNNSKQTGDRCRIDHEARKAAR